MILHLKGSNISRQSLELRQNEPEAVVVKHSLEVFKGFTEYGIRINGFGNFTVTVDISGASLQRVFALLETTGIKAVDLEPRDLALWNGSPRLIAFLSSTAPTLQAAEVQDRARRMMRHLVIDEINAAAERIIFAAIGGFLAEYVLPPMPPDAFEAKEERQRKLREEEEARSRRASEAAGFGEETPAPDKCPHGAPLDVWCFTCQQENQF